MRLQPRRSGTTLVEMMVVVVIAAILLSMAAPSFHGLISSMRLRAVAELFVAHLNFARSEAIKRNARVVLCKSTDGKQCAATGRWDQGWIVFHDANDNAQTDVDEPVLLQQPALHASIRFSGNTNVAKYVSYTPDGGANLVSGGFQAGTFTLCTRSDVPMGATQIFISRAGQARVAKTSLDSCL